MKEIPLTQGKVALVDDEDYEWLSQQKWFAHHDKRRDLWYAVHNHESGGKTYMHRAVLALKPGELADHRNHNGLDNRRENLRSCTESQNQANAQKRRDGRTSKFKGVSWDRYNDRWRAEIHHHKIHRRLGYFVSEVEAARAYNVAAMRLFGEFALLNNLAE